MLSLQWEVEDSATLHRWHVKQGAALNTEMMKVFKDKVHRFPHINGGNKVIQPVKEKSFSVSTRVRTSWDTGY